MNRVCYIVLVLLLFIATLNDTSAQVKIDWKSDIEFVKTELPKKHKDLFFQFSRDNFEKNLDQLSNLPDTLSDLYFALMLQKVIVKVGDAHTTTRYYDFLNREKSLPFSFVWLSDGLTINSTTKQNSEILGGKLKKVNGYPVEVIIDSLSTLFVFDNEAGKKVSIPALLLFEELLDFFGFLNGGLPVVEVESEVGELISCQLKPGKLNADSIVEIKPDIKPFYRESADLFFAEKYFFEDSIYYIQYNKCWSRELERAYGSKNRAKDMPSFVDFEQTVFKTIRERPIKKLIVDMRFNSGGSSLQGTDFIKQLAGYDFLNKRNMMYVVIGRRTFSSGILNVLDFKRLTKAVTIGEETAGRPNHFGEVEILKLPSSQMSVYYSTHYFKWSSEKKDSIEPDVKCPVSFTDYKNGVDPVYDYVRKQK